MLDVTLPQRGDIRLDSVDLGIRFVRECESCISFCCIPCYENLLFSINKLVVIRWLCKADHFFVISGRINDVKLCNTVAKALLTKKVLLCERKRHSAYHVASTRCAVSFGGGGNYPGCGGPTLDGGYLLWKMVPALAGGIITLAGRYIPLLRGNYLGQGIPTLDGGTYLDQGVPTPHLR